MTRDEEKNEEAGKEEDVPNDPMADDAEEATLEEPVIGEEEAEFRDEEDEDKAEDGGEDDVLTTQDAPDQGKELRKPDPESIDPPEKDRVMEAGADTPTLPGPSTVVVNRAAIVYLAKHLLAPPDLDDFKTAFPSMF